MDKKELKAKVNAAIDARFADIQNFGENIFHEPELGFKETKTAAKVKNLFDSLGLEYVDGLGITGIKARMKGRQSRRTVAVLAELDAIVCRDHPDCDTTTGAAHCCGHNIQLANLAAIAMAFKDTGIMNELDGDVVFFAVPAEEYVEIDYRNKLREEGKLRYLGGKCELIAQGAFDDIDMALQMHADPATSPCGNIMLGASCNGFIGKLIEYRGVAAHAAGAPDKGVNALNAAMMGVMGVNAIRETFREDDCVRFHPIINSGGDLVNVIPDRVTMESYVRAANIEALALYNRKINRALKAGADAIGATCEIKDLPGYLPLKPNLAMRELLRANSEVIFGKENVMEGVHSAGSTDMGDVSHIMPVVHPWVGCVSGVLHGASYRLTDPKTAYDKSPKALAMTVIDLLADGAEAADAICKDFKPLLTKASYCEYMDKIARGE